MKREQTQLLDFAINPMFLEQIKQSNASIAIQSWISFNMERNDRTYHVTMYTGKEGQVNISPCYEYGNMSRHTIITDYCQTIDDFVSLLEKLDDLAKRMPNIE